MLVGRIAEQENHWYHLSDDTIVSFHTAFLDKERTVSTIFVSDENTWPSITADRLGINYFFMRNSTREEIAEFMEDANIVFALSNRNEEEE